MGGFIRWTAVATGANRHGQALTHNIGWRGHARTSTGEHAVVDAKIATDHVCLGRSGVAGKVLVGVCLFAGAVLSIVDSHDASVATAESKWFELRLWPGASGAETCG